MKERKYFLDNDEGGFFDTLDEAKDYVLENYKPSDVEEGKVKFIVGDDWPDSGNLTTTDILVSKDKKGKKITFGKAKKN